MDNSALQDLALELVNECQAGDLSSSLNMTGSCESVEVPGESASDDSIVYETPQPDRLVFTVAADPKYENVPLRVQPKIQAIDIQVCEDTLSIIHEALSKRAFCNTFELY